MVLLVFGFVVFILLPHVLPGYLAVENANYSFVLVSNMINKLSGQPESYEKKYESIPLSLLSQSDPSSQISCI